MLMRLSFPIHWKSLSCEKRSSFPLAAMWPAHMNQPRRIFIEATGIQRVAAETLRNLCLQPAAIGILSRGNLHYACHVCVRRRFDVEAILASALLPSIVAF